MEVPNGVSSPTESAPSGEADDGTKFGVIVDLLITVGYVDGLFHRLERAFVHQYIDSVLLFIEESAPADQAASLRAEWRTYFDDLCEQLDAEIAVLAEEVPETEDDDYVPRRIRERALSLYGSLPAQDQETAIELVHALIHADGMITPPKQSLHEELMYIVPLPPAGPSTPTARMQALTDDEAGPPPAAPALPPLIVCAPVWNDLLALSDPLLDPLEQTYSPHPVERKSQIEWDYHLIQRAITRWQHQRTTGAGRLAGLTVVDQIPVGAHFLDGHVHVLRPDHPVELVVLGDLHGCYSCLKAALLQSNFVERVWAHQWDPERYPDVKLVLLGDYIDRGLFSFDGVLRAALQLFVSMPDNVILLRGNHEYLRWFNNHIISGVHPAEALASIAPHVPLEMLDTYRILFEHMPTSFVCDRTLFVHAGIPRDDTFEARYRDLSSLNDLELRFQMMWSDPVQSQHVPVDLQRQSPRFAFGYKQFQSFMERTGLHTMVRGHEKIENGFQVVYDLGQHRLLNLFSAGGEDNCDLPAHSSYRKVTPMALTMQFGEGTPTATPWPLEYHSFNYPPHNGLYRPHPVLPFRYV